MRKRGFPIPKRFLLSVSLLFFFVVPAFAGTVSLEKARETARNFLSAQSHLTLNGTEFWRKASIEGPVLYYGLNDTEQAYCFLIEKDGKETGFVMVSAREEACPVQEFSVLPPPHQRALESCQNELRKYLVSHGISGRTEEDPALIYLAPGLYFFRFSVSETSGQKSRFLVEMRSATVVPEGRISAGPGSTGPETSRPTPEKPPLPKYKAVFTFLPGFPSFSFFISAHPTAAAMVLSYRHLRRPNEPEKVLIGELANYVTTCGCGKREEVLEIAKGIKIFCALRGYQAETAEYCRRSSVETELTTFEKVRQEIDQNRPVLLCLAVGGNSSQGLSSAKRAPWLGCVPAIGYRSDRTGKYLVVRESPFAGEDSFSSLPVPEPRLAFYNWDGIADNLIVITIPKITEEK